MPKLLIAFASATLLLASSGIWKANARTIVCLPTTCTECKQPLIMIDNRGRHLQGCLTCNEWRDSAGNAVAKCVWWRNTRPRTVIARIEKMKAVALEERPDPIERSNC